MSRTTIARIAAATAMLAAAAGSTVALSPYASASEHGLDVKGTVTSRTTLSVHTAPSTHAPKAGAALKSGARIVLDCNLNGTSVGGNDVWYKLADRHAWVAAKYVHPSHQVVACTAAQVPADAHAKVTTDHLTVRRAPSTHDSSAGSISRGKHADVWCKVSSQSIGGTTTWYQVGNGQGGWVSAHYVRTTAKVPYCSQEG